MFTDKLKLLRSLRLLEGADDAQLAALGDYLKPRALKDGEIIFEEGAKGESLFFVAEGRVRISKKVVKGAGRDLAILEAGDCFGEMALVDSSGRSARASALGSASVLELSREDLERWLKKNPQLAMRFFAELVQIQSRRLRRTSCELALLHDLTSLFLEVSAGPKELLEKALTQLLTHLEGAWACGAWLYNMFNDEVEEAARAGKLAPPQPQKLPSLRETRYEWLDDRTFYASLPALKAPLGYLLLQADTAVDPEARGELSRVLQATAQLLASALENVNFRNEDALRARLKGASSGSF